VNKSAPLPIHSAEFDYVLSSDNVEFLHEIIRGSGIGAPQIFEAKKVRESNEQRVTSQEKEKAKVEPDKRAYWGLNVHGMKRKDLASKNDPDATSRENRSYEMPLLWKAILGRATKIVEYLSTERPLEAYGYYASHYNDARAKNLRARGDLAPGYPEWIGWKSDELGESPLVAALNSVENLEMLQNLFELQPTLMSEHIDDP
jgi:hypothetical protein